MGRPPSATRRVLTLPGAAGLVPRVAALAAVVVVLLLTQWTLLAHVVSSVFAGRATPLDLLLPLAALLAVWLLRAAVVAGRDLVSASASSRVRASVRAALATKLLRLGPQAVTGERAGELVGTATEGVSRLDAIVARFVPGAVTAAVITPAVAIAVLALDPASGLILLGSGPLLVVLLWLVGTQAERSAREQWRALGQLGALLVDTLRMLPTLVTYGRATAATDWLNRTSEGYRAATMRVLRTAFLSGFVLEFGASLCVALVAVTVGIRLFEGQLELEVALLVLLLAPEFFAPLRALGADHHARLEGAPAAERLWAILDAPEPARGTRSVPAGVPHLRLRGVRVAHEGREVLAGVDLDLPPRSRTALVGPSGAGKTTLLQLLLALRTADSGEVLVGDVPLAELDPDAWRSMISYVPERPFLLPGSVADNVRLGRPQATDAEVERALIRARAIDFVRRLPRGLDEPVGDDGAWLSGGERLRLALARAFVADTAVVILDEPTSQLDPRTQAQVLAAIDELASGRTLVSVSHQAAALSVHDRVFRLADGLLLEHEAVR